MKYVFEREDTFSGTQNYGYREREGGRKMCSGAYNINKKCKRNGKERER